MLQYSNDRFQSISPRAPLKFNSDKITLSKMNQKIQDQDEIILQEEEETDDNETKIEELDEHNAIEMPKNNIYK